MSNYGNYFGTLVGIHICSGELSVNGIISEIIRIKKIPRKHIKDSDRFNRIHNLTIDLYFKSLEHKKNIFTWNKEKK